ncbi:unnamed protein product [Ostreobium quekettii]|uniref:Uncharacterized protein n=1 Tax=Ostreobium quekettii TaxID=121088 RepID=A0A8S1JCC9_9CHLO|nr:unnamed protein product [Ostreobium quekettii]
MGIRKHMNESLFDQLPVLKDLERRLDELALCAEQPSGDVQNARLILEQVPRVREQLLHRQDWEEVATNQQYLHFGEDGENMEAERMQSMLKYLDFMCNMEPGTKKGDSGRSSSLPVVKVEVRRREQGQLWTRFSEYSFEVDSEKDPEPLELSSQNGLNMVGSTVVQARTACGAR